MLYLLLICTKNKKSRACKFTNNTLALFISIPLNDGVLFRIKRISEIMEEADYPGVRVSMETKFDGVITPLKIDISTGDIITPREIKYNFNLMLEDRTIEVWAYNYEINSHII